MCRTSFVLLMVAGPGAAWAADTDRDGLDDLVELGLGTDPARPDTDGDRFSDGGEVLVLGTDPLIVDPICEWPAHPITADSSPGLLPVDLDGDGDVDVVDLGYPDLHAWENLGAGGFRDHVVVPDLPTFSARAGDLDSDGRPDLVVGGWNRVSTIRNQGGWVFGPVQNVASLEQAETLAVEDLDGDGDPDIVAWENIHDPPYDWNYGVSIENLGAGFAAAKVLDRDDFHTGVAVGDLDNDGTPDIAAAGGRDVWWYRNVGPPLAFGPRIPIGVWGPQGTGDGVLSIADLDGDGWQDVFYPDTSRGYLTVLWNEGGGGGRAFGASVLTDPTTRVMLPGAKSAWPGDADGDGDLDVWVQYQVAQTEHVGWVENRGGRQLRAVASLALGRYSPGLGAADLDDDGDLDLLAPGNFDPTAWIENIGVGDPDADGLDSRDEVCLVGTDPRDPDTDGGGAPDGAELQVGRDPLDPADDP